MAVEIVRVKAEIGLERDAGEGKCTNERICAWDY